VKLKDVRASQTLELWVKPVFGDAPFTLADIGVIGDLRPDDDRGHIYTLRLAGQARPVSLRDAAGEKTLNHYFKRGCAGLAEVEQVARDGGAWVRSVFFYGEIVEIGPIKVGLDEYVRTMAKNNGLVCESVERLARALKEKCNLESNGENFFIFMSGRPADKDFMADQDEGGGEARIRAAALETDRAFSIHGERIRIPVKKQNPGGRGDVFLASTIVGDAREKEGALRLARGSVEFSDRAGAGRVRALAAGAMRLLTQKSGSYLKRWDEYGGIEGDILLKKARYVGRINYQRRSKAEGEGVEFFVPGLSERVWERLSEDDEMEITSEEPVYLQQDDLTWEKYSELLQAEFEASKKHPKDIKGPWATARILRLPKKGQEPSIVLDLSELPPEGMFMVLSINGDKIQIQRRIRARTAILEGRCANPLLGLLIEEGEELPPVRRWGPRLPPLTPFVKRKIFAKKEEEPTPRQIKAIDIALNTPDIALIQGPPGTGKTKVITAIIERLNEEFDKTDSVRGRILVTGFQHYAVENIVSRLSVNALPTVKFGQRSGGGDPEPARETEIARWCSDLADKIRQKKPHLRQTEEQRLLAGQLATYAACPSQANTSDLLDRILALPRGLISGQLLDEAEKIRQTLVKPPSDAPRVLRLIRALRTTPAAFEDDGPERALDLLLELENKPEKPLEPAEADLLEKAGAWRSGAPLGFLAELKTLQGKLLSDHIPRPEFRVTKARADVLDLAAKASLDLKNARKHGDKREAVLAEFLNELDNNPDGLREALEDYNFVFAATVQHAEHKDIRRAKKKSGEDAVVYDTVIVDEAARVSPRDLLIPLAQAEKRIILVGDQRQLPHIIDEEIERALERGDDRPEIKKSMFEYLFERMKKLKKQGGPERTVTLDAQYRSHPLLGEFVSENFYKKDGGFSSPLTEEKGNFSQRLPDIEGKAAVWIDVPPGQGPKKEEPLPNFSRKREAEADVLAKRLKLWFDSKEAEGLSFGVISFYRGQVEEIRKKLEGRGLAIKEHGLMKRAPDGSWEKVPNLENGQERLRIGTVDAFQGMEFDIVLLSMVRSLGRLPDGAADDERLQRRIFGHLMSENRLCVGMSRQKKVLAVVGDSSLIDTKIAGKAVPALHEFYKLCRRKGVTL